MSTSHVHSFICPETDHAPGKHHDRTLFGLTLARARDENARNYPHCTGRYIGKHVTPAAWLVRMEERRAALFGGAA